jgi:signal transduction histidine kinase
MALPPAAALPVAIVGLAFFAGTMLALASRVHIDFDPPVGWGLILFATLGLVALILGLVRRAAGYSEETIVENELLLRDRDVLKLALADRDNAYDDAVAVLGAAPLHMLLFDPSYQILGSYSPELSTLFRERELREENLLGPLRRILPESKFKAARDFLATLFDERRSDAEVAAGNPLQRVEAMMPGADGTSVPHVFAFAFKRIYRGGAIERALLWAEDLTSRLQDETELRSREASKARQFDLLLDLAAVERGPVDEFIAAAGDELRAIDGLFRAGDAPLATQAELLRERVAGILECVEAIERGARAAGLRSFERRAGTYRAKVASALEREHLGGDDFLTLVMEHSAFRAELEELHTLRERLDRRDAASLEAEPQTPLPAAEPAQIEPADEVVEDIAALAQELALVSRKEVVVDADGFDTGALNVETRDVVRAVLEELTRNAVVHGIEDPELREVIGKPRAGRILIRRDGNGASQAFAFSFRDDGRGLDAQGDAHAASLLFAPGSGGGMTTIKRRVIEECGGSISVDSEYGAFCAFSFVLPERAEEV